MDFAGDVVSAPPGSGFQPGDRVACVLPYGGGGELVSVHGAAGGVGTASTQVARGLGARTIEVVSLAPLGRLLVVGFTRRSRSTACGQLRTRDPGAATLQRWASCTSTASSSST